MQNDVRDFTKEEAKQYKENLNKIYKPIGGNIFMNEKEYTYTVKYPLGTYLYVVELYRNPKDATDRYFKLTFEGTLIGILLSQNQEGDNKEVYTHYTIGNEYNTMCVSPDEPEYTYLFDNKEDAEAFCDNPSFYEKN